MKPKALLILALAAAARLYAGEAAGPGGAAAAPAPSNDAAAHDGEMKKYESVHFTLYADFADDEYTRRLMADLEKNFSVLQKEFWDFIPVRFREGHVEAIVFANAAGFDEYSRRDAGMPHGTKGYLNAESRRMAILRQDEYYKDVMIAVHELTHVFNSMCAPYTPVWLDEGMAQFYANEAAERMGGTAIKDGINPASLEVIDFALKMGSLPRMSALLRMKDEEFYGAGSRENFAAAWALVLYLRRGLGAGSGDLFSRYYAVLARGGDDYRAFTGVYGSNMQVLEQLWLLYLEGLYRQTPRQMPQDAYEARQGPATEGDVSDGAVRGAAD